MAGSMLPIDLLATEILLRLPPKSLMRFKCVSNLWLSLINDPSFVKSYEARKGTGSLLIFPNSIYEPDRSSFIINDYDNNNVKRQYRATIIDPYNLPSTVVATTNMVNGLVCFYHRKKITEPLYLYNITTHEKLQLPPPNPSNAFHPCSKEYSLLQECRLGFDPNNQEYKLFHLWNTEFKGLECEVLMLCNTKRRTWKPMDMSSCIKRSLRFPSWFGSSKPSFCHDGVLYCIFYYNDYDVLLDTILMAFNVEHEKLELINYPQEEVHSITLAQLQGQLSLISTPYEKYAKDIEITVWRLLDKREGDGKLRLWDKEVIKCSFLDSRLITCTDFGLITCVILASDGEIATIQGYDLVTRKPAKFEINNARGLFPSEIPHFHPHNFVENVIPLKII